MDALEIDDLDLLLYDDIADFLARLYEILKQHKDILGDSWELWDEDN